MAPGMRTKCVALSNPRAPEGRPGIVQGGIASGRRLIGEKKSRLDRLPIQNRSDQLGVTHRASVQSEVDTRPTTGRMDRLDRFEAWRNRVQWRTRIQTQGARLSMYKPCGERPTLIDLTIRRSARSTIATDRAHRWVTQSVRPSAAISMQSGPLGTGISPASPIESMSTMVTVLATRLEKNKWRRSPYGRTLWAPSPVMIRRTDRRARQSMELT